MKICPFFSQWNSKNQRYVPEVMLFFVKILQMINPSDKSRRFVLCSSKQIQKSDLLILKDDVQLFDEFFFLVFFRKVFRENSL